MVPIWVGDFDLYEAEQADLTGLEGFHQARVLVRYAGRPLTELRLEVMDGCVPGAVIWREALRSCGSLLQQRMVERRLGLDVDPFPAGTRPQTYTVAICTRNRSDDLQRCLNSLCPHLPEGGEVVVVDNAPSDDRTRQLCQRFPVRYVREPTPGLYAARARGAAEARGEIVLYTDDDVVVGPDWVEAMLAPFADPGVAAVTGPVLPAELKAPAQQMFEAHSGFDRGLQFRRFSAACLNPLAAARVGAGANMAFRRHVLMTVRPFSAVLDGGTPAESGGDTYAFYLLLSRAHTIVFQPEAVVRHHHRKTESELRRMLRAYSIGTYVYLLRCLLVHHEAGAVKVGLDYFRKHHLRHLYRRLRGKPDANPLALTLAEIRGFLAAPRAYLAVRRAERKGAVSA